MGSRYVPGGSIPEWSAWRRALSRWGNRYAIAVLGLPATDATSGFRAYRSDVLAAVAYQTIAADGYAFQIEGTYRVARSGGTVTEVPIQFVERTQGASKMSSRIIVEALALVSWWGLRDRTTRRRATLSSPSPRGTRPRR
jgi:dolichol-phosphate mannosyltransferase